MKNEMDAVLFCMILATVGMVGGIHVHEAFLAAAAMFGYSALIYAILVIPKKWSDHTNE